MGLDAFVFCSCYEKGRLKRPPPHPELVHVLPNGDLDCRTEDDKILQRFDHWREKACSHASGMVAGCWLGNAAHIARIRQELAAQHRRYPVLLRKVLYSGTHCGDHLTLKTVAKLRTELCLLKTHRSLNKELDRAIQLIRKQLQRLVRASIKVHKPIAF
jgi:hypothetical protein